MIDILVQSGESKEMVDKIDVGSMSYSIEQENDVKKIVRRNTMMKFVCHIIKFDERLNLMHAYTH